MRSCEHSLQITTRLLMTRKKGLTSARSACWCGILRLRAPPNTVRSGSLRASGLLGCHFSPRSSCCSCFSCLLDCKEEAWQGCSRCVFGLCISWSCESNMACLAPLQKIHTATASQTQILMLRCCHFLLHAAAGACCSSVFVAVGLPLTNKGVPPLRGLQLRTETGGPTSAPALAFEFYPIRLLI